MPFQMMNQMNVMEEEEEPPAAHQKEENVILVDLKGAVVKPGVYQMKPGQRINDLIMLAGGFQNDADADRVNLAEVLQDEAVVFVPRKGEESPVFELQKKDSGKVDINKADQQELETIPEFTPSKAAAILNYREENGLFSKVEDLTKVAGIGEKTLERIKESIMVSN